MFKKILVIAALALIPLSARAAIDYKAIDGDTYRDPSGISIRATGFDTPETFQAGCPEEKAHGLKAKAEAQRQLDQAVRITILPQPRPDKYGRKLAQVLVDGRDIGLILIRKGLAVPYTGKVRRVVNHNWCLALQNQ